MSQSPNADLCGQPGSRRRLNTPALLIDLDAFEHNLAAMAALATRAGLGLRPHAKAHKSVAVARRQLAAGALGISCATLGEAEVMAGAGLPGILVTSPVVTPPMIQRLAALLAGGFTSVDYVELADAESLKPLGEPGDRPARLFVAARIGGTRLIDNMPVN